MPRLIIMKAALPLLLVGVLAGCQDLEVVNTNEPDRDRALTSPADIETLVASTWRDKWGRLHNSGSSVNTMPLIADEMSGTYANNAALELSSQPRPPLNNNTLSDAHGTGRFQWEDWYKAISSASDALAAIDGGLRIVTEGEDNTTRAWAFGKFMQGIAHGYLALLFDQAFIVNEYTNLEDPSAVPLQQPDAVRDSAIKFLMQAIDTMNARPFTLPTTWIPIRTWTSEQLARVGHSYIARFLAYHPRTPAERGQVNWAKVIEHVDKGITEDYEADLESGTLTSALYSRYQTAGTFSAWGDYQMIGPADVSGRFAAWLATPVAERERFLITTPDRRITGVTPTSDGSYFRYRADNIFRPERGTYHHSHYQWYRHRKQYNSTSISTTGVAKLMSVDEMNLIKAEALIRLGRAAEAVPLINATRTRPRQLTQGGGSVVPGLPPVTVNGVPQAADCVPKLDGVNCADLMGALMYERMIEGALLDALRAYVDSRGWGRLTEGTFVQFPIPGRELEALNLPIYSFGGVGGPGGAICTQPSCK